jgi:hypothetical protein
VTQANRGGAQTGPETTILAQASLVTAGTDTAVCELVADKGYHDNRLLRQCEEWNIRTDLYSRAPPEAPLSDKQSRQIRAAVSGQPAAVRSKKGRRLNRWRSERCERTFAHVCETGGRRRTWLRGLENVRKMHLLRCAAYNVVLLLRKVWGLSKRRSQTGREGPFFAIFTSTTKTSIIASTGRGLLQGVRQLAVSIMLLPRAGDRNTPCTSQIRETAFFNGLRLLRNVAGIMRLAFG